MKNLPQISEAEYKVMKVIWKYAPVNTNEVAAHLSDSGWSPKTIQTMLLRLVKKGALGKEKQGRLFVYSPLVQEEEYRTNASRNFLNRFYDGALGCMVLNFIRQDQLSEDEIQELRRILEENGRGETTADEKTHQTHTGKEPNHG